METAQLNETPPPPGTDQWHDAVARLHAALARSSYRAISRVPTQPNRLALVIEPVNMWGYLTGRGQRIMQPTFMPAFYRRIERFRDPARERQLALFFLNEALPSDQVNSALAQLPDAPDAAELLDAGILAEGDEPDTLRCRLRFVPSGELTIVADPFDRSIPDFVYIGPDSLVFARRLRRHLRGRTFRRSLDLCCGCGVQGLTTGEFADVVEGTDINPRAIAYANLNAELAGLGDRARFTTGDLSYGLEGPYDLVVANPPYVWMTPQEGETNRDGYGGELGLEIAGRILADLDRLLARNGEAHMVCDSPVIHGESALVNLTKRTLAETGLGAVFHAMRYIVYRERVQFQRAQGCSHVVYYHVRISRDLPSGVRIEPLPPPARLANSAYVKIANWVYG